MDKVAGIYENEIDKIKAILDWTNNQWAHTGTNISSKSDPLPILEEAKKGNNFRCVVKNFMT